MRCEKCHGHRVFIIWDSTLPCPECGGTGVAYCCESEQAQPDPVEQLEDVDTPADTKPASQRT